LSTWRERAWSLPEARARILAQRLTDAGSTGATVASGASGAELTLWTQGRDAAAVAAILATLPAPSHDHRHDEAALLATHAPGGPCELADGWWIDPSGRSRLPRGVRRLIVPPLPAFGDGRHPSTRLAARALLSLDIAGQTVLDLGCGTGVLGLMARLRGARRVDLTDIDPASVRAARAVFARNRQPRPRAWQADLLDGVRGSGYGLVIGNLYADLCQRLLADPRLGEVLPSGTLLLSGIAERRRPLVERALRRAGFAITARADEAWWWTLTATR
jgi:ribosomal protein L11 methylase PrmA